MPLAIRNMFASTALLAAGYVCENYMGFGRDSRVVLIDDDIVRQRLKVSAAQPRMLRPRTESRPACRSRITRSPYRRDPPLTPKPFEIFHPLALRNK